MMQEATRSASSNREPRAEFDPSRMKPQNFYDLPLSRDHTPGPIQGDAVNPYLSDGPARSP